MKTTKFQTRKYAPEKNHYKQTTTQKISSAKLSRVSYLHPSHGGAL